MPATKNIAARATVIFLHSAKSEAATHTTTPVDISALEGMAILVLDYGAITGTSDPVLKQSAASAGTFIVIPDKSANIGGTFLVSGAVPQITTVAAGAGRRVIILDVDMLDAWLEIVNTIGTGPSVYEAVIFGYSKYNN